MTPPAHVRGGQSRRVLLVATLLLLLAAFGFVNLGTFLALEDPIQKADAIFVLAGTPMGRGLEGVDLYLAGYGSALVLSRDTADGAFMEIEKRGVPVADDIARARAVFLELGVPPAALIVPERTHTNTAAEAETARAMALERRWRRIIVVSSPYHLRRAAVAFRRELRDTGVEVIMRPTRYETVEPRRWWRHRGDIRSVVQEIPRLIAYVLGLGA